MDTIRDVPTLQVLLHYAHRRYGLREFADAPERYERAAQLPADRAFRRMLDPNAVADPADMARLGSIDFMVTAALGCDRTPLPPDYRRRLEDHRRLGRYDLTHVLVALELLRENGCTALAAPGYEDSVAREVAALVASQGPPTDLEIESEALLSLVGCGELMHPGFARRLMLAQRADGGFSPSGRDSESSHWHPSAFALWVLLSARYPNAPQAPFIASR